MTLPNDADALRRALSPLASRSRRALPAPPGVAEAAVLLPLFFQEDGLHVWVVRRPDRMRKHAGQIAFPGGKRDPSDPTAIAAALREAHEEIGLPPSVVEVLGPLDDLLTGTGFVITPVVGLLAGAFTPLPNPAEVDRVHAFPLARFAEPASGIFPRIGYPIGEDLLWGATFAIGRQFVALLRELHRAI